MGQDGCRENEETVFDHPTPDFRKRPRRGIQFASGRGIAIDQSFDPSEDVFQKDGVRTGPAAPKTAQQGCDEKEGKSHPGDRKKEDPEVLRVKSQPEEVEFPLCDIEKDCRSLVDRDPRQGHIDDEE